ncbi:MAG: dipicolinate synthase [Clostridia bacterium]|nr:dipicolinate synthase [Clostridia bacterium]
MKRKNKLAVLGGDLRQCLLAERLAKRYETAVWGVPASARIGDAVRCADWKSAVRESGAVILPLPCTRDGVTVNCPLFSDKALRLSELADFLPEGTLLLAGKAEPSFLSRLREKGVAVYDYFACEELQIKNALPTAEGALEILLREMPVTVAGSRFAIFGFGRVGRAVARALVPLGGRVTVCARSRRDLAEAEVCGCVPLPLTEPDFLARFSAVRPDAVINTVPSRIIGQPLLSLFGEETVLLDLASGEGGVDPAAAAQMRVRVIRALSLPGKTAPKTAAAILGDCILARLREEENA